MLPLRMIRSRMTQDSTTQDFKLSHIPDEYVNLPDRRYGIDERPLAKWAINGLKNKYIESVLSASTQSIPDSTWTALTMSTRKTNLPKMLGSGFFSVKDTGYYTLTATVNFAYNATGYRAVRFTTTWGATPWQVAYAYWSPIASIDTTISLTWCGYLKDGQTIAVETYQNSGGAINVKDSSNAVTYATLSQVFKLNT